MDADAYADMLPWLVFIVIDRKAGLDVTWASGGAVVCSAGLLSWEYWRGRRSPVPRLAFAVFGASLVAAVASPWWNAAIGLPRAVSIGALSLAALASVRWSPLSETYTLRLAPPALWSDRRFRKVNVEMTLAWGVGAALVAAASGTTDLMHDAYSLTFVAWLTPLLLAGGTVLWTSRRWQLFRLGTEGLPRASAVEGPETSLGLHGGAGPAHLEAEIRRMPAEREQRVGSGEA